MTKRKVVMIEGDGIGPELCQAVRTVIAGTGAPIEWVMAEAGLGCLEHHGTPLPDATLALMREHRVGIKGPTDTPSGGGHRSVNVGLRVALDLYACVRRMRSLGAHHRLAAVYPNVDVVIVRQNTEGLYAGLEATGDSPAGEELRALIARHFGREFAADARFGIKFYTPRETERIIRYAFEYARRHGRKRVTLLDKSNIQKITDGLYLELFERIAPEYPDIAHNRWVVDSGSGRLVHAPEEFDVIIEDSLYGDITSDVAAELIGGLGLAPGANIGDETALFEATHGTWPKAAGKDIANPTSLLLSAVEMLEHLHALDVAQNPAPCNQVGYGWVADHLRTAIERVVSRGERVTPDIWRKRVVRPEELAHMEPPRSGTQEMARAITEEYLAVVDEVRSR